MVIHLAAKREDANRTIEVTGQGNYERGLASPWWTREQVATAIRNATLPVPIARIDEPLQIIDDPFRLSVRSDDTVERTRDFGGNIEPVVVRPDTN